MIEKEKRKKSLKCLLYSQKQNPPHKKEHSRQNTPPQIEHKKLSQNPTKKPCIKYKNTFTFYCKLKPYTT